MAEAESQYKKEKFQTLQCHFAIFLLKGLERRLKSQAGGVEGRSDTGRDTDVRCGEQSTSQRDWSLPFLPLPLS